MGTTAKTRRRSRRLWPFAAGAIALLLGGWLAFDLSALPSTSELAKLRSGAIRETALMRARKHEAEAKKRRWAPRQQWSELSGISSAVIAAVTASEDARFFMHKGIDTAEMKAAVEDAVNEHRKLRGASTITQQVVKNLFLSEERSLWRKAEEVLLAFRLESAVPKRRILTIYLNIAEWGDGIFGIGAAARAYFDKSAAELDLAEAAALAGMLPSPHRIGPWSKDLFVARARHVIDRVEEDALAPPEELAAARAELDGWVKPKPAAEPEPQAAAPAPEPKDEPPAPETPTPPAASGEDAESQP